MKVVHFLPGNLAIDGVNHDTEIRALEVLLHHVHVLLTAGRVPDVQLEVGRDARFNLHVVIDLKFLVGPGAWLVRFAGVSLYELVDNSRLADC